MAKQIRIATAVVLALALTACGSTSQSMFGSSSQGATVSSGYGYGVVQSVEVVPKENSNALGTIAGAVVGGVIGNQIGSGSGRTAATIAGAAGGGYVGNRMQNNANAGAQTHRITLRMDDGSLQTLTQDNPPALRNGERVRVENGAIVGRAH